MMGAAAMGATAFQKGLGAIHALSHPVGALYDTHHGLTNAVFMPYVLAFNRDGDRGQDRRGSPPISASRAASTASPEAVLEAAQGVEGAAHAAGPDKGLDMDKKRKALIANMAPVDPTAGGNPVKLTKKAALTLLENAITGGLWRSMDRAELGSEVAAKLN